MLQFSEFWTRFKTYSWHFLLIMQSLFMCFCNYNQVPEAMKRLWNDLKQVDLFACWTILSQSAITSSTQPGRTQQNFPCFALFLHPFENCGQNDLGWALSRVFWFPRQSDYKFLSFKLVHEIFLAQYIASFSSTRPAQLGGIPAWT